MIKVVMIDGRNIPIIVCDQCGQPIKDCQDGNAEWKMSATSGILEDGKAYFTHKACCHEFERANRGSYNWYASELGAWLTFLVHNVKANTREVQDNADALEQL